MNDVFHYENGRLMVEQVSLATIADAVGTPAYVYSSAGMCAQLAALQNAFSGQRMTVCYAIKANSNIAVVRTLANQARRG